MRRLARLSSMKGHGLSSGMIRTRILDFRNRFRFLTFGNTTVHILRLDQAAPWHEDTLERDEPCRSCCMPRPKT